MHNDEREIDAAFDACAASGADDAGVEALRQLIEPMLISRLTIVSTDPNAIRDSIDDAFSRFSAGPFEWTSVNLRAWLVATSVACLTERLDCTGWLDRQIPPFFTGTPLEKRTVVVGLILTLDGRCQWRLLKCIRGSWLDELKARTCVSALAEGLRGMDRPD